MQVFSEGFKALFDTERLADQSTQNKTADDDHDLLALQGELEPDEQDRQPQPDHQSLPHPGGEIPPCPPADQTTNGNGGDVDDCPLQDQNLDSSGQFLLLTMTDSQG